MSSTNPSSETQDSGQKTADAASSASPLGMVEELVGKVGEQLPIHVDARTVFGEPISQGERTVIPVARVSVGFGFGAGMGQNPEGHASSFGGGAGGGGGAQGDPVGYIEITPTSSRFVPTVDVTRIATLSLRMWSIMLPRMMFRAMRRRRGLA